MRIESAEVLYAADGVVTVDAEAIAGLKRDASRNPRERIRLCTHRGTGDAVHEMLIVHAASAYVRPHKHIGKAESFHVIEGRVDVVLFDDEGEVGDVIPMGEYASGLPFYYRIDQPVFHTLLIRSAVLVFHETTSGPFKREQTVFAAWSPDSEPAAVAAYMSDVDSRARSFLAGKSK